MATNYPFNHGGLDNGGTRRFLHAMRSAGELARWTWTPKHEWSCRILSSHLFGANASQGVTVTIPASGFVSGSLTLTFAGDALSVDVDVVAYAAVGDANTDLGDAMETALNTAIAGDLAGVLASVENTAASNVLNLTFVAGVGSVTVTATWRSAQQVDVEFVGTLIDSDYTLTLDGGGLGAPVAVTTTRAAGTPAAITDMIIQRETDLEALIGTTLAGVLVSADDDAATINTLIFEPDIVDVTLVTSENPVSIALQFGGTITDGTYSTTFAHSSLPGGTATVETIRAASVPVDDAAMAVQHEADIEADVRLTGLIASADDDAVDTCIVIGHPGVTGLTATTAAPSPGTLDQTELDQTTRDQTPVGPTVTVSYTATITLADIARYGRFPTHSVRRTVALEVVTAFGASRTITVGDAVDPDGLMGSTPVDLNTTGRSLYSSSDAEYLHRYEAALAPTATIDLGSSPTVSAGEAWVQISYVPAPAVEVAA